MTLEDAIFTVLQEAEKPLRAAEITQAILSGNLWQTDGKTPAATVSARLYSHIKKNGNQSIFVKVAPQTFALRDNSLPEQINQKEPIRQNVALVQSNQKRGLPFVECAQKVLDEFASKNPMHYKEITRIALEQTWLHTDGKTPDATMYAQIITDIKRQLKRGEQSRFVQHGRGYVGLSRWMGKGLSFQIEQHNKQIRKKLRDRLLDMTPGEFEELIAQLLAEIGFEMVEVTRMNGDGGIDVRGTLVVGDVVRIKMAVQVKKWKPKNNVQSPDVQRVRGSLGAHEQGLIMTTSDFSSGAIKEAAQLDKTPIALMNGEQLVLLLMEHNIGVHRSICELFELADL